MQSVLRGIRFAGARLAVLGVLVFVFLVVPQVCLAQLPPSTGAPSVGQKAPAFTLPDQQGNMVSLHGLLKSGGIPKVKGLVLIFYRGYW